MGFPGEMLLPTRRTGGCLLERSDPRRASLTPFDDAGSLQMGQRAFDCDQGAIADFDQIKLRRQRIPWLKTLPPDIIQDPEPGFLVFQHYFVPVPFFVKLSMQKYTM